MIRNPVLVDTGPIVAALDQSDEHHERCLTQLREIAKPLFTCWPVLTEAAWLLRKYPQHVRELLATCNGDPYEILLLAHRDTLSINWLFEKYEDQSIQLADASLLHLADREHIEHLFTLDRRDFEIFRTAKGKALKLLP